MSKRRVSGVGVKAFVIPKHQAGRVNICEKPFSVNYILNPFCPGAEELLMSLIQENSEAIEKERLK